MQRLELGLLVVQGHRQQVVQHGQLVLVGTVVWEGLLEGLHGRGLQHVDVLEALLEVVERVGPTCGGRELHAGFALGVEKQGLQGVLPARRRNDVLGVACPIVVRALALAQVALQGNLQLVADGIANAVQDGAHRLHLEGRRGASQGLVQNEEDVVHERGGQLKDVRWIQRVGLPHSLLHRLLEEAVLNLHILVDELLHSPRKPRLLHQPVVVPAILRKRGLPRFFVSDHLHHRGGDIVHVAMELLGALGNQRCLL
mmetsp:Transcript_63385/g.182463  ORF Transcript_63385/g.182463 Transcript_63385/m.182463 type:complete len:256 (-) Transcript_63385:1023-1790(-)